LITEREEEQARELFMLPGWRTLMDELEDQADLCNLDACNNVEDLFFNKGRLAVIRMLLNYESYVLRLGEEEDEDYALQ
jgi:hypothetical protein